MNKKILFVYIGIIFLGLGAIVFSIWVNNFTKSNEVMDEQQLLKDHNDIDDLYNNEKNNSTNSFQVEEKEPNVKELIKQKLREDANISNDGMLYLPFGEELLKHEVDPKMVQINSQHDVDIANHKISYWSYESAARVVDNFRELGCKNTIIRDNSGYECALILEDLSGTGLYEPMIINRSKRFYFTFIERNGNYIPVELEYTEEFWNK